MQLVEHDALQRRKQKRRVVGGQQQRQLLGRGQQDIRRIAPLPLPPRHRRVAGAGLDLDRQPHLGDRRLQIAGDIDRQRLQRRNVERVEAAAAFTPRPVEMRLFLPPPRREGAESSTSVGRNPASVLPAPVGAISSAERSSRAFSSSATDARAATSRVRRTTPEGIRQQRSRFKRREGQGIGRRHARKR